MKFIMGELRLKEAETKQIYLCFEKFFILSNLVVIKNIVLETLD